MMRFRFFAVGALVLGPAAALAQPNSTTLCPITHNCRPVTGQGTERKTAVPPSVPTVGAIPCPAGTYQIPNTNKCRVK